MKISVAIVTSIDGKLTRHNESNITLWTSPEDQAHFRALIAHHDAIVMGRVTYETIQDSPQLKDGKLRIVLTSKPEQYADRAVEGQLEFSSETVVQLAERLSKQDVQTLLVAGGKRMITDFLQAELVDDFYHTIEPRIFGEGAPFVLDTPLDISLKLVETRTLNDRGTLLLVYKVVK